MMRDFMIIAYFFHDQAARLSGMRDLPGMGRPLSRRERETLQLAARGFAPKQIAADLRVSTTAVRLYLQTARTDLLTRYPPSTLSKKRRSRSCFSGLTALSG